MFFLFVNFSRLRKKKRDTKKSRVPSKEYEGIRDTRRDTKFVSLVFFYLNIFLRDKGYEVLFFYGLISFLTFLISAPQSLLSTPKKG